MGMIIAMLTFLVFPAQQMTDPFLRPTQEKRGDYGKALGVLTGMRN